MTASHIASRCEAIRRERQRAGITQARLAARIGVGQSHIAKIEGGHRTPTLEFCYRLAVALGCPPSALDPALTTKALSPAPRIITDYRDLPDELGGADFVYESPTPHARRRR